MDCVIRFDQLADTLDPDTAEVEHTDDLRNVAVASEAVQSDQARLSRGRRNRLEATLGG